MFYYVLSVEAIFNTLSKCPRHLYRRLLLCIIVHVPARIRDGFVITDIEATVAAHYCAFSIASRRTFQSSIVRSIRKNVALKG